jgi:hypothetical protein
MIHEIIQKMFPIIWNRGHSGYHLVAVALEINGRYLHMDTDVAMDARSA